MKNNKSIITGAILGIPYGLMARFLFGLDDSKEYLEIMSIAFIFLVPMIIGGISICFGTVEQRKSRTFQVYSPWITIFVFLIINWLTGMEALLCIVMLLPAFMFSASVGGIIMGIILKSRRQPKTLKIVLFLPLLVGVIESNFDRGSGFYTVETSIIVNSNKNAIWSEIKSIKNIKEDELEWTLSHAIGIPKPLNSELSFEGVEGERKITWDKGIEFTEKITAWKHEEEFTYEIEIDNIPINAVDKHIEVGGKYFDMISGGYKIEELEKSKCRVTLHTKYEVRTRFNFYSKFWADFIIDDFHHAILHLAKQRIEDSGS